MFRDWVVNAFRFVLALDMLDTAIVGVLIAAGYPVPAWLMFIPTLNGKPLLPGIVTLARETTIGTINVEVVYFLFIIVPQGIVVLFVNLFLGIIAGLPVLVMNVASSVGLPATAAYMLMILALFYQALVWLYVADALIYLVVGRDILSIFGA